MNENKKPIMIMISDNRSNVWLRRLLALALIVVAPIVIGIIADSVAMQWMGFIMALLFFFALTHSVIKNEKTMTITEARAYLDHLENEDKG